MIDLIKNGYVYCATPPLYMVKKGKDLNKYCWSDEEKDKIVAELTKGGTQSEKWGKIQRYKGLER